MLPAAVQWLGERYAPERAWDLGALTISVPTAEAGRRLLELLVTEAGTSGLTPPRILTPGALPELLYAPSKPLAGPLQSILARVHALKQADRDMLAHVIAHPPEEHAWDAWWSLARHIAQLIEELAAAGLAVADVPQRCAECGVERVDHERWRALAALEHSYLRTLDAMDLADRHAERLAAMTRGSCRLDGPLVLLGTMDASTALATMIEQSLGRVTALIHAPAEHAGGFDATGRLRPAYWRAQRVTLRDDMLRFVDRPVDQAVEVVRVLAERASERYAADQVTVGLGDEQQADAVRRALSLANLPARYAAGAPLTQSRPALVLAALGRFLGQRGFDNLAELVRYPDIEDYLRRATGRGQGANWITLLDDYAAAHLQERVDGQWLGSGIQQQRLQALWRAVTSLLNVAPDDRRSLPLWSRPIAHALQAVYGDQTLIRHSQEDEPLVAALQAIATVLREHASLPAESPATPVVTAAQAISFVLARLSGETVAEPGGAPAIELMGYLRLPLDDAPLLVVTSMNEGAVPGALSADPFLPDSVRGAIGMPDDARRYARDLLSLQTVVHSRPEVVLIAHRHAADGQPVAPSRLLLACDDDALVRRIQRFYDEGARDAAPLLLTPGKTDRFLLPLPVVNGPPLTQLRVTGFRDYLACPYRFYLRHVRKLRAIDDGATEMDGLSFGVLAHRALEEFGRSELTACQDEREVATFLSRALDSHAARQFGPMPRPAIRVQVEQLRLRLEVFARQQVQETRAGWRIVREGVESERRGDVMVDGAPFMIVGKVDRIDHHPEQGWRILDYKTGDTARSPDKGHRSGARGQSQWVDLQLPLYRDLYAPMMGAARVELGYINLGKDPDQVMRAAADWDEDTLASARVQRDAVIRGVRQQIFWPPEEPPKYADELAGLCADRALNRQDIITASERSGA